MAKGHVEQVSSSNSPSSRSKLQTPSPPPHPHPQHTLPYHPPPPPNTHKHKPTPTYFSHLLGLLPTPHLERFSSHNSDSSLSSHPIEYLHPRLTTRHLPPNHLPTLGHLPTLSPHLPTSRLQFYSTASR